MEIFKVNLNQPLTRPDKYYKSMKLSNYLSI
jgi:hypothetical protein